MPIVRVGILDSGVGAAVLPYVVRARRFEAEGDGRVVAASLTADRVGHGTVVARTLLAHTESQSVQIVVAQTFSESMRAAPEVVAAGLAWLAAEDVGLVCLSVGLRSGHRGLQLAAEAALGSGATVVAAAPARGGPVYPAAYPGVIAVCGDARCGPHEVSELGGAPADYGACPRPHGDAFGRSVGGASCAAAHVAGLLAGFLCRSRAGESGGAREYLSHTARYRGREHRSN
jgi:hypothetical protein